MADHATPRLFDCAAKAEPGEPTFTLLGRDLSAGATVLAWCRLWEDEIRLGTRPPTDMRQVREARTIADEMTAYAIARRRRKSMLANRQNFPDLAAQGQHPLCPGEILTWAQLAKE